MCSVLSCNRFVWNWGYRIVKFYFCWVINAKLIIGILTYILIICMDLFRFQINEYTCLWFSDFFPTLLTFFYAKIYPTRLICYISKRVGLFSPYSFIWNLRVIVFLWDISRYMTFTNLRLCKYFETFFAEISIYLHFKVNSKQVNSITGGID